VTTGITAGSPGVNAVFCWEHGHEALVRTSRAQLGPPRPSYTMSLVALHQSTSGGRVPAWGPRARPSRSWPAFYMWTCQCLRVRLGGRRRNALSYYVYFKFVGPSQGQQWALWVNLAFWAASSFAGVNLAVVGGKSLGLPCFTDTWESSFPIMEVLLFIVLQSLLYTFWYIYCHITPSWVYIKTPV